MNNGTFRAFEYAVENSLPICVQCRSGGARMQEGTSSLMQMAKVSVAVQALHEKGLPFVTVLPNCSAPSPEVQFGIG